MPKSEASYLLITKKVMNATLNQCAYAINNYLAVNIPASIQARTQNYRSTGAILSTFESI